MQTAKKEQKNERKQTKLLRSARPLWLVQEVCWRWAMHGALGRAVPDIDLSYTQIAQLQQIFLSNKRRFKWTRYCEIDEVVEDSEASVNGLVDL